MKQGELTVFGDVKRPLKFLRMDEIRQCEDETAAKNLTLSSGPIKKDYVLAELLNRDAGNFSKMRKGLAAFPPNSDLQIMEVSNNIGYVQYLLYKLNLKAVPMSPEEIETNAREEIEALKEQNEMLQQQLTGNW